MMGSVASLADRGLKLGIPPAPPEVTWRGFCKWASPREEAKAREGLDQIFDKKDASSNEYVGVNSLTLEYERTQRNLIQLIKRFEVEGFSFGLDEEIRCDAASAEAASAFIRALPAQYLLPKIAPDGEGGIILAWENAERELVMSVCGWTLYPVINPLSKPEHLNSLNFDGEKIPDQILRHLPTI
jgi:hypothetical protein